MVEPRNAGTLPYAYITLDKSAGVLRALLSRGLKGWFGCRQFALGKMEAPERYIPGLHLCLRESGDERATLIKTLGMKLRSRN